MAAEADGVQLGGDIVLRGDGGRRAAAVAAGGGARGAGAGVAGSRATRAQALPAQARSSGRRRGSHDACPAAAPFEQSGGGADSGGRRWRRPGMALDGGRAPAARPAACRGSSRSPAARRRRRRISPSPRRRVAAAAGREVLRPPATVRRHDAGRRGVGRTGRRRGGSCGASGASGAIVASVAVRSNSGGGLPASAVPAGGAAGYGVRRRSGWPSGARWSRARLGGLTSWRWRRRVSAACGGGSASAARGRRSVGFRGGLNSGGWSSPAADRRRFRQCRRLEAAASAGGCSGGFRRSAAAAASFRGSFGGEAEASDDATAAAVRAGGGGGGRSFRGRRRRRRRRPELSHVGGGGGGGGRAIRRQRRPWRRPRPGGRRGRESASRSPRVALLDELGDDADGDLARLIAAEMQADRAVKRVEVLGRDAGGGEFAFEHLAFGLAADDAEIRKPPALAEDLFEDRPIGAVAHRHAEDERVGGKRGDLRAAGRRCSTFVSRGDVGKRASHSCARIDAR